MWQIFLSKILPSNRKLLPINSQSKIKMKKHLKWITTKGSWLTKKGSLSTFQMRSTFVRITQWMCSDWWMFCNKGFSSWEWKIIFYGAWSGKGRRVMKLVEMSGTAMGLAWYFHSKIEGEEALEGLTLLIS